MTIQTAILNAGYSSPKPACHFSNRTDLLRQLINHRSTGRLVLWVLSNLFKGVVALLTVAFVLFTVEMSGGTVLAMFALPLMFLVTGAALARYVHGRTARCLAAEHGRRVKSEQQRAMAEDRLALLKAHVDPDYVSNSLETLRLMMKKEPRQADVMVAQLVHYLRLSMSSLSVDSSTLGAEMELVDAYLHVAATRMEKRLFVHVSCPPELREMPFPSLVIHALVENALVHGAGPSLTSVMVEVRAYVMAGRLIIDVQDDGVGLSRKAADLNEGGINNSRLRLRKAYGEQAHLMVTGQPKRGVLSRIEVENQAQGF